MCLLQVKEDSNLDVEACTFDELQELTSKQLSSTKTLLRKAVRMHSLKVPKQQPHTAYQPANQSADRMGRGSLGRSVSRSISADRMGAGQSRPISQLISQPIRSGWGSLGPVSQLISQLIRWGRYCLILHSYVHPTLICAGHAVIRELGAV